MSDLVESCKETAMRIARYMFELGAASSLLGELVDI